MVILQLSVSLFPRRAGDQIENFALRDREPIVLEAIVDRAEPVPDPLSSRGIYNTRLLLPHDQIEEEMWAIFTPKWLNASHSALTTRGFNPSYHQLTLSGSALRVLGPRARLYSRIDQAAVSWDELRDLLINAPRTLSELATTSGLISLGEHSVYVVNLDLNPNATLPAAISDRPSS